MMAALIGCSTRITPVSSAPEVEGSSRPAAEEKAADNAQDDAWRANLCDGICRKEAEVDADLGCQPDPDCGGVCRQSVASFPSCAEHFTAIADCTLKQPSSEFMCKPGHGEDLKPGVCATDKQAFTDCLMRQ